MAGRVLRLGYFTSQPSALLTALCDNGDRVDLFVVPPDAETGTADAAMVLAATTGNLVPAQYILFTASTAGIHDRQRARRSWETDGGHPRA